MEFTKGHGYWDVTYYPYGGSFHRFTGTEDGKIIEENVGKYPKREVKVRLTDGRVLIVDREAIIG